MGQSTINMGRVMLRQRVLGGYLTLYIEAGSDTRQ